MKRYLNETDIRRIVKRVFLERNEDLEMVPGISYNRNTELVDDVIMRIKEHGDEYIRALNKLNMDYPTEKYKRIPRPTRDTFELPKGVKVKSSTFPNEDY